MELLVLACYAMKPVLLLFSRHRKDLEMGRGPCHLEREKHNHTDCPGRRIWAESGSGKVRSEEPAQGVIKRKKKKKYWGSLMDRNKWYNIMKKLKLWFILLWHKNVCYLAKDWVTEEKEHAASEPNLQVTNPKETEHKMRKLGWNFVYILYILIYI